VLNKDLREMINVLLPSFSHLSWKRVKAHATNKYNNMVDKLARDEALRIQKTIPKEFVPPVVQQPDSPKSLF
jgi:ribonuclease HI